MLRKIFGFLGIDRRDDIREAIDATIKLGDELDSKRTFSRGEIEEKFKSLVYDQNVRAVYMTHGGFVLRQSTDDANKLETVSGNINCLIMKAALVIPEQDILEFSYFLASDPFIRKAVSVSEAQNTRRDVAVQGLTELVKRCPQEDKDKLWSLLSKSALVGALMENQLLADSVDFFGSAVSHLPDQEAVDQLRSFHVWQSLPKTQDFNDHFRYRFSRLAGALDVDDRNPRFDQDTMS